ncbi:hypothetical protein DESA109040_16700 [Deinococcus saxicola]
MYAAQNAPATSASVTPIGSSAPAVPCGEIRKMPSPASATHRKSSARRDSAAARSSGPRNSSVTAMASGSRSSDR